MIPGVELHDRNEIRNYPFKIRIFRFSPAGDPRVWASHPRVDPRVTRMTRGSTLTHPDRALVFVSVIPGEEKG